MSNIIVWAVDIGSIKNGNFGWCRAYSFQNTTHGESISDLAEGVAKDLLEGRRVALGFECPLFVPITTDPNDLTKARNGEGNRSWSAGAGCGALTTGLVECVWIFERIRELAKMAATPVLDWDRFQGGEGNLFIWEAFVSKDAKGGSHTDDATTAARAFWSKLPNMNEANAIKAAHPFSLVGAAMLRSGLSTDVQLLSQPCVVIVASGVI